VPKIVLFSWLHQQKDVMLCPLNIFLLGTDGMNGYICESKYCWPTFCHDHRNSSIEGLTIDLTQTLLFSLDKTTEGHNIK